MPQYCTPRLALGTSSGMCLLAAQLHWCTVRSAEQRRVEIPVFGSRSQAQIL